MKKVLTIIAVLSATAVFAAAEKTEKTAKSEKAAKTETGTSSALVAARSKISQIVANPKLMTSVVKTLSASDQLKFLSEVNRAIDKMSGSNEEKTALFLNVDRAALEGSAKGNMANMVAEVYATVPVQSLTVINETLAEDVFNRAADPKVTYTDEQYTEIAKKTMKVVNERLESATDSGVRSGFAALMMIRASNSESAEIKEAVIETLPAVVQETAKKEWFPAALASEASRSYEPMLGMADGEISTPDEDNVLRIAGVQEVEALLADLTGSDTDATLKINETKPVTEAVYSPLQRDMTKLTVGDGAGSAEGNIGAIKAAEEEELRNPDPGPGPYAEQTLF